MTWGEATPIAVAATVLGAFWREGIRVISDKFAKSRPTNGNGNGGVKLSDPSLYLLKDLMRETVADGFEQRAAPILREQLAVLKTVSENSEKTKDGIIELVAVSRRRD